MFQTLDNFRDFGGFPTTDGRRMASGRFFRSAHLGELNEDDAAALDRLSLDLIVDLRRPLERRHQPGRRPFGFKGAVIENDIGGEDDDPWLTMIRTSECLTADHFRDYMVNYYAEAPFVERHLDLFARYFEALSEVEGGVLIHCAAGKDRTGMLVALTQHLAGVADQDILHDYMLTNDPDAMARRVPRVARFLIRQAGREISLEAVAAGCRVEVHYLQTAFDAIRARYGSPDDYLEQALGIDAARRDIIRKRITS